MRMHVVPVGPATARRADGDGTLFSNTLCYAAGMTLQCLQSGGGITAVAQRVASSIPPSDCAAFSHARASEQHKAN